MSCTITKEQLFIDHSYNESDEEETHSSGTADDSAIHSLIQPKTTSKD